MPLSSFHPLHPRNADLNGRTLAGSTKSLMSICATGTSSGAAMTVEKTHIDRAR
jgi:hypothetical protein